MPDAVRVSFFISKVFHDAHAKLSFAFNLFRSGVFPREIWLGLINQRHDNKPIDAPMTEDQYNRVKGFLQSKTETGKLIPVVVDDVPEWVKQRFLNMRSDILPPKCFRYLTELESVGKSDVVNQILPFQLDGLAYGVMKEGRCLIADEMGLGKSLQALMIAYEYSGTDWPLLIVCPSSIRFVWKQQISRWFDGLINPRTDVQVITKGKDIMNPKSRIIIVPYVLLATNPHLSELPGKKPFQCIICDESHYMKDSKSKRSIAVLALLKKSKRAILLSGTPSMNNADELYPQIVHLFPKKNRCRPPTLAEYRHRYCISSTFTPKNSSFPITRWSGSQYREELNALLLSTVMIRRMKKDVLTQLPDKIRQRVDLDVGESLWCKELQQMTARWLASTTNGQSSGYTNQTMETMELWRATGAAKLHAIKEYLTDLLTANESSSNFKCIVFAHHKFVLDGLEDLVSATIGPGKYMRIDGSVSQDHRAIRVSDFQGNSDCRVALLSITACAEGITLTAANLVVFTELYWVPGVIEQAEARAHRVGQKDSVFCQYLLLPNSPDEVVYNMLEKKKKDTSTILDGVETGLVMGQSQTSDKDLADLIGDDSQWCPAPGEIPITKKLRLD